jgi:hypothetical protein
MNTLILSATLIATGGIGSGRLVPTVAAVLGLIGVVIGGLHSANSAGGFGTANGLAGAIVAIVVGLISLGLGGLTMARSGQNPPTRRPPPAGQKQPV